MVSEHEHRSLYYRELGYHAPLRFALEQGLRWIDFGSGHPLPKLARGAREEPQWHLIGTHGRTTR